MNKKRVLTIIVVSLVLLGLVFLQIRSWRHNFQWSRLKEGTEDIRWLHILFGVLIIHIADGLRAVRWKIFLRRRRPKATALSLIAPQYVGFAGLALLGRPGEFIRPYIIARKLNLSFPSQLALWFVERACDVGAVTIILSADIIFGRTLREDYPGCVIAGYVLVGLFFGFVLLNWGLWRHGPAVAAWICKRISRFSKDYADSFEKKLRAVSEGMNAIKDRRSFLEVTFISLAIWLLVAFAYRQVTHAFLPDTDVYQLNLPEVILLMGGSVAGGVLQLPFIGGGSQLGTLFLLSSEDWFGVTPELAVACAILLWLVTFMSVIPAGLLLAHREHISLREIGEESEEEAEAETGDD